MKSAIHDMEKERDFYFGKLRNIELICQEKEGDEDATLSRIINILYATDVRSLNLLNPSLLTRSPGTRGQTSCCYPHLLIGLE